MENRIYILRERGWESLRPSLTRGITAAGLIPEGHTNVTVSITRVEPSGEFRPHADEYHHVLYFMDGIGEVELDGKVHEVGPGTVVQVKSGTPHGYRNRSSGEMVLLTINLPVR